MGSLELRIGLLPALGWLLWWAGGRGLLGTKAWRREIWPAAASLLLILTGAAWWRCLFAAPFMDVAHRLGYGSNDTLAERALACAAIGASVVLFGAPWGWGVFIAVWFAGLYAASLRWNWVTWSAVEASTGLWQGVALCWAR